MGEGKEGWGGQGGWVEQGEGEGGKNRRGRARRREGKEMRSTEGRGKVRAQEMLLYTNLFLCSHIYIIVMKIYIYSFLFQ